MQVQVQRREEAADQATADLARKVAELSQKDKSTSEKEKSLSALTADLWAKVTSLIHATSTGSAQFAALCSTLLS